MRVRQGRPLFAFTRTGGFCASFRGVGEGYFEHYPFSGVAAFDEEGRIIEKVDSLLTGSYRPPEGTAFFMTLSHLKVFNEGKEGVRVPLSTLYRVLPPGEEGMFTDSRGISLPSFPFTATTPEDTKAVLESRGVPPPVIESILRYVFGGDGRETN